MNSTLLSRENVYLQNTFYIFLKINNHRIPHHNFNTGKDHEPNI